MHEKNKKIKAALVILDTRRDHGPHFPAFPCQLTDSARPYPTFLLKSS
jgi:hypothetical protein